MREDGGACAEGGPKAGRRRQAPPGGEAPGARVDAAKEKAGQKPGVKEYACMLAAGYKRYRYKRDTERNMICVPYPRGYQRLRRPMGRQEP